MEQQAAESGASVGDIVVSVDNMLGQLADAAGSSEGVPPGVAQRLAKLRADFSGIMDELAGGGQQAPAQGVAAPEAGGAPGAVPESMQRMG